MAHKYLKDRTYINMIKNNDYAGLVEYHNRLAHAARQLNDNDSLLEHQMKAREYLFFIKDKLLN